METTTIEKRKETMVDALKSRATNLIPKTSFEEAIIILVDVSGSMNGGCENGKSKLENVKRSLPGLWARGSYVSYGLVAFSTQSYPITQPTTNFQRLLTEAETLMIYDMTNIPAAMRDGLIMLQDLVTERKRMILMTDGHNNSEQFEMERLIEQCVSANIVVDTIAFGADADEVLLSGIAKRTGGIFTKAISALQLAETYRNLNFQVRYIENK